MRVDFIDRTGQKFGRLTFVRFVRKEGRDYYWLFKCDCGNEKVLPSRNVVKKIGNTKSCGCLHIEKCKTGDNKRTHGMGGTRFYSVYSSMVERCNSPQMQFYKYYGGRGIKCLWKSFEEFRDDMYESYQAHVKEFGVKQTTIDRIDVNGHYFKENCRWATWKEQANNKRPRQHRESFVSC